MKTPASSFFILALLVLLSCKKDGGISVSTAINIKVLNALGQDLLNAPLLYDKNNITVPPIKNGQNVANTGGSSPKIIIDKGQLGLNVLTLHPSLPESLNLNEQLTETLLQFGNANPDTVRCKFLINDGSIYCSKIWVNGALKFSDEPQTNTVPRSITLVK